METAGWLAPAAHTKALPAEKIHSIPVNSDSMFESFSRLHLHANGYKNWASILKQGNYLN